MKKQFKNRLAAIEWIANKAENEGQFEVMREQLMFNFIYSGQHYLEMETHDYEVILLNEKR